MLPTDLPLTRLLATSATEEPQPSQTQQQVTNQAKVAGRCLLDSATDVSDFPPAATSLQERGRRTLKALEVIEELRVKTFHYNSDKKNFSKNVAKLMKLVQELVYSMPPGPKKQNVVTVALKIAHDLIREDFTVTAVLCARNVQFLKSLVLALEGAGPISKDGVGPLKPSQNEILTALMSKTINGKPWIEIAEDIDTRQYSGTAEEGIRFIVALSKVSVHMHLNEPS